MTLTGIRALPRILTIFIVLAFATTVAAQRCHSMTYAFALPSPDPNQEIGVYDGVIANTAPSSGMLVSEGPLPGTPSPSDLAKYLWGKPQPESLIGTTPPSPVPKPQASKMPNGYWLDVGTLTTILPGKSIYFSLPRNHVSPMWHVQIEFNFALDVPSIIPSPKSYVTLYEDQIDQEVRAQKTN